MALYVKNSGSWTEPSLVYVKTGGVWVPSDVWIKEAGTWVKVFPASGSYDNSSPGNYNLVIPNGVRSITVDMSGGAGGGGGGGAASGGANGGNGFRDIRSVSVTPGETITIKVGGGGTGGRDGLANCGSDGAAWFAINGNPASRGGLGYTSFGQTVGTDGSGAGCYFSFTATGGWSGGGGSSSSISGSFGTVIAGAGNGGNGGGRPVDGATGIGGSGGNNGVGNQGATGATGGAGNPAQLDVGYAGTGSNGYVNISW